MGFGNAGLLLGALLGALPIVIHLINRHRARLVPFAAIEFLLLSDKRLARRLRLKQLLVLALRVLLIVALAVALAKPYLEPEGSADLDVSAPGAVALVVDDSLSMSATDADGETALSRALAEARRLISARGVRTSIAIVTASAPARVLTEAPTFDGDVLEAALGQVTPTARGQDLGGALREAGRLLSASGEARRQIVVLSDNMAHAWADGPRDWPWAPVTELTHLPLGGPRPNVSIADVAPRAEAEGLAVVATVENHGAAEVTVTVTARLGAVGPGGTRTASEVVTVAPRGRGEVTLRFRRDEASTAPVEGVPPAPAASSAGAPEADRGEVSLEAPPEANALAADDRFFFTTAGRRGVRTLLVNGAPVSTSWLDELFFVRPALAVTPDGSPPLQLTALDAGAVSPGHIAASDVVVLANVGTLTPALRVALEQHVERGGGLLVAGGDRLDPQASNAPYGALLPTPLRELRATGGNRGDPQDALQALTVGALDFSHPVLSIFQGLADTSLLRAQIARYLLVDVPAVGGPGTADPTSGHPRVLASLANGAPLLVEGRLGRGRILLFTTTLDRDWTDLALRPSFPPLLQRMVAWLGHAVDDAARPVSGREVGDRFEVPAPDGTGPVIVTRPDGAEDRRDLAEGEAVFLSEVEPAGLWQLARAGDRARTRAVAVNVPRAERDLTAADAAAVEAVRTLLTRDNGVLAAPVAGEGEDADAATLEGAGRTVLWPWILAGLFLLFASEAWLLVKS
jgi:hypothetical protein